MFLEIEVSYWHFCPFPKLFCVCVLILGLWLSSLWGRQPGLLPSGWPCSLQKLQHQSHPGPHCQGHDWPLSNTHIYMQVPEKSWETPYPVTSLHTNIYAQTNAHVHIKLSFHLRGHDLSLIHLHTLCLVLKLHSDMNSPGPATAACKHLNKVDLNI